MALNFCVTHHFSTISSSKISTDGYEATNLISSDDKCRRRGFLAASFITPPVDIVVSFAEPIEISHVILRLNNGSQQTTGVKLYTRSAKGGRTGTFNFIGGKEGVTDSELHFYNNHYQSTYLFSTFPFTMPSSQRLYLRDASLISFVLSLKVCLTRTAHSSVPALSKLEIWGQPASICSEDVKRGIFQRELSARASITELSQHNRTHEDSAGSAKEYIEMKAEVPSEFLDSITCEMMSQPILLPSGNNVDCLTLEKYIETSSTWGRLPGDPFTGVPFTKTNQPVPNSELKTRIDQFWLSNPESCSGGRCVGYTSKSKLQFLKSNNSVVTHGKTINTGHMENKHELSYERKLVKRKQDHMETPSASKISVKKRLTEIGGSTEHAKELADSLKMSLRSVLVGRPSFLCGFPADDSVEPNSCSTCNGLNERPMYSLPCKHLLCRTCLLDQIKSKNLCCKKCLAEFESSTVVCFHE